MVVESGVPVHEELGARLSDALADRYELKERVGSGSTAHVYRARDRRYDRPVAIKVLRPDRTDAVGTRRFVEELRTSVQLEDPGIVQVFDSGEADGILFYVMPFYEDVESLEERLDRSGALDLPDALRMIRDVGDALSFAHEHGVVHRDVKPGNILLVGGRALLTDFGIARALSAATATRLTAQGMAIGTPAYMSPEQVAADEEPGPASDQYGLACVLHEMLTGDPVFHGRSAAAVARKHLALDPPALSDLRPGIPAGVEDAVLRALAKAPEDRFPSVAAFLKALEDAVDDARPRRLFGVRKRSLARGAAAGIAVLLTAALLWWAWPAGTPTWDGVPESVAVLAFAPAGASEPERALAVELSERIQQELNRWDSIHAESGSTLSGDARDLGIPGPPFESMRAALTLARQVETQAVFRVTARIRGDSAFVGGRMYEAGTGRPASGPVNSAGLVSGPAGLAQPLLLAILGLDDESELRRGTWNLHALAEEREGYAALLQGDLTTAEAHFQNAVRSDGTWPVALHRRALVGYLVEAVESGRPPLPVEPAVAWSARAVDRADVNELPENERLHIQALHRFLTRDFRGSRRDYQRIVADSPGDIVGWLMLGAVEWNDLTLEQTASGAWWPQADLNRARAAFRRTFGLRPGFELGYVMATHLQRYLEEVVDGGGCDAFTEEGDDFGTAKGLTVANRVEAFCPLVADSIEWLPYDPFHDLPDERIRRGVDHLSHQHQQDLKRWAAESPGSARAHRVLSESLLADRRRSGLTTPERLQTRARDALERERTAFALRSDTTPADLVRLANLHLAAERPPEAADLTRRALAASEEDSADLPLSAANVLLATGHTTPALERISREDRSTAIPLDDGRILSDAGAEVIWIRMQALVATGVRGEPLHAEVARADSLWTAAGIRAEDRPILKASPVVHLSTVFAVEPQLLAEWGEVPTERHPVLAFLVRTEAEGAMNPDELEALATETRNSLTPARDAFILGILAGRYGDPSTAIRLYSRLDSIPFRVAEYDRGWGLRYLSLHLRALELEKLGRLHEAATLEERFLSAWTEPDPLTSHVREEAEALLERAGRR